MTDEVLLPGFIVGGFRSFHGEPQFIGPLGKVTVIAGQNNDGKSNVLLAARKLLPAVQMTSTEWPFEELDRPVDIEPSPALLTGIAVATTGSRTEALRLRLINPDAVAAGTNTYEALAQLAQASAFDAPETPAGNLLWFRLELADNKLAPQSEQLDALLRQTSNLIPLFESQLSHRSSPIVDLGNLFGHLKAGLVSPPVVLIPAIRAVIGNPDAAGPELSDLAGLGLPQLLQALQSPKATRFREDSVRFERSTISCARFLSGRTPRFSFHTTVRPSTSVWVRRCSRLPTSGLASRNWYSSRPWPRGTRALSSASRNPSCICIQPCSAALWPTCGARRRTST